MDDDIDNLLRAIRRLMGIIQAHEVTLHLILDQLPEARRVIESIDPDKLEGFLLPVHLSDESIADSVRTLQRMGRERPAQDPGVAG